MHILVLNTGSSSIKFSLYEQGKLLKARGLIERIGMEDTRLVYRNFRNLETVKPVHVNDIREAIERAASLLIHGDGAVIPTLETVDAVGHRVVHGGEKARNPVEITEEIIQAIKECASLAPLHNPAALKGIDACRRIFPDSFQVAVFDTAFHATIPKYAYLYGLPYSFYENHQIRRYGFHGTNHQYVSRSISELISRPLERLKIITCHLGNGCSIAAVDGGRCVDTSMGMTPLEGLIMGTRPGDMDPGVLLFLMNRLGLSPEELNRLLNHQSGLFGLSGAVSSDVRDLLAKSSGGDARAKTALQAFAYRARKYIGAYTFAMGGLDAIGFSGGIGENSPDIREMVCRGLNGLGIELDFNKNRIDASNNRFISSRESRIKLLVIPSDEETEIARQVKSIITTAGQ